MSDASIIPIRAERDMPVHRPVAAWHAAAMLPEALVPVLIAANGAVVVIDAVGTVIGWNGGAQELFGWSASDAIGCVMSELIIPARLRDAHARGMERSIASGHAQLGRRACAFDALHRDGHEHAVEINLCSGCSDGLTFFIAFIEPSEQRRAATIDAMRSERAATTHVRAFLDDAHRLSHLTTQSDVDAFELPARLEARMAGLLRAHDLSAATEWQGIDLRALCATFLGSAVAAGRAALLGEHIALSAAQVVPLAMVVHELHCNALQFGALAARSGELAVLWQVSPDVLTLEWLENCKGSVRADVTRGAGMTLAESLVRKDLRGEIRWFWRQTGLCVRIELPLHPGSSADAVSPD